jgi:predicted deacylase
MPQSLDTLKIPSSVEGPSREIPVITVEASRPGPTALVTANVHGDEITGVGAVHALAEVLESTLKAGRVHLYPSLNPDGLAARTRKVPPDGPDLNRLFPGQGDGPPAQRLARVIWEELRGRRPDLVVDLHADAPAAIPYAIVDRAVSLGGTRRLRLEHECENLARASGLTVLREYPDQQYLHYGLQHSLAGATTNEMAIPAVTIEAGPRLRLDPAAVEITVTAVLGILTEAGIAKSPAPQHPSRVEGGPWRRAAGPRASTAGILQILVKPGDALVEGQVLAEVRALSGQRLETLEAASDSVVISLCERAWVAPGVSCCTLATMDPS